MPGFAPSRHNRLAGFGRPESTAYVLVIGRAVFGKVGKSFFRFGKSVNPVAHRKASSATANCGKRFAAFRLRKRTTRNRVRVVFHTFKSKIFFKTNFPSHEQVDYGAEYPFLFLLMEV
jgi:hypothetical protein